MDSTHYSVTRGCPIKVAMSRRPASIRRDFQLPSSRNQFPITPTARSAVERVAEKIDRESLAVSKLSSHSARLFTDGNVDVPRFSCASLLLRFVLRKREREREEGRRATEVSCEKRIRRG